MIGKSKKIQFCKTDILEKRYELEEIIMSWLEVPAGVEMPTTTTYERAVKRRKAKFDAWYESQYIEPTPQEKYNLAMQNYWSTKEHNEKVNKRRAKRGLEPLPMPEKPNKRDYMTEEGGNK